MSGPRINERLSGRVENRILAGDKRALHDITEQLTIDAGERISRTMSGASEDCEELLGHGGEHAGFNAVAGCIADADSKPAERQREELVEIAADRFHGM